MLDELVKKSDHQSVSCQTRDVSLFFNIFVKVVEEQAARNARPTQIDGRSALAAQRPAEPVFPSHFHNNSTSKSQEYAIPTAGFIKWKPRE